MSEYEREIELYDYIEVLLQYKWFIVAATLVCGGLGWFFRPAPPPPLYEADAVVEVRGVSSATDGQQGASGGSVSASGASYSTLALSDEVKRALIDSLKLPMSIAGLDGVLKVEAESPGLRFSVQVHDSSLPIPILNAWLQFFAEGSRAVNLEDNRVAVQNLELVKDIDAMEFQRSELDTIVKQLFVESSSIQTAMRQIESGADGNLLQGIDASASAHTFLGEFDRAHNYTGVRSFLVETGLDSLLGVISTLKDELRIYPPVLGSGANQGPNPTYASIAERLSAARSAYASRKTQLESAGNGPDKRSDVNIEAVFLIAEQRRDIVDWFELRSALQQVESAMQAASAQRDQVVETMRERLRLVDDGRNASISFSELLKRAVASRQRATDDVRVLARALEVRTVPQEGGQNKTALAAGVGLLLSAILSLLIEYVRKARRLREQGAAHE